MKKCNTTLPEKYPNLVQEWHPLLNDRLPENVVIGSHYKAYWICKTCKNIWRTRVLERTNRNFGCPYCRNLFVWSGNSLATIFPNIAKEWNYNKNGSLLPNDVVFGSNKKIWWKCDVGHEWKTTISCRTIEKNNCSICYNKSSAKEGNPAWTGFKDISGVFWNDIKHGAKLRNIEFNITKEYIWDIFIKQNKLCKLSGLPLIMYKNKGTKNRTASLDRVDSSKGYVEGNVQWVHKIINMMKGNLPDSDFVDWCTKISNFKTENIKDVTLEFTKSTSSLS